MEKAGIGAGFFLLTRCFAGAYFWLFTLVFTDRSFGRPVLEFLQSAQTFLLALGRSQHDPATGPLELGALVLRPLSDAIA